MSIIRENLHLVDADGFAVPVTEKGAPPYDPWDDPIWDFIRIELGPEPDAAAELPPISGGSPEPKREDLEDLEAWLSQVDRPDPPDDQVDDFPVGRPAEKFPDRLSVEALANIADIIRRGR